MQVLTTGGMEDFRNYLGIYWMFSVICCMFWIFSPAEGNTITGVVGSEVILPCKNESNSTLYQLIWKRNGTILFGFHPERPLHIGEEALRLNINMSESELYPLVIKSVQKSHTGNYTCDFNTEKRTHERKWELIIADPEFKKARNMLVIAVASIVPCVCCLIFIIAWIILHRIRKQRAEDHSPTTEMQEKEEDIYENCLEIEVSQRRGYNQHHRYKHRTR
ncbi:uncharacterized protein LOC116395494 [Anarrhichthys ocellatus]|uniref:uncharacterized protein LOC116395494 n=1 Tax=Anarrhichthys ocellatus TaxID=433405 RepID=UPI0012EEDE41|nr:uncharacterized protein LOC116395494 [Anarrhichthys ocellatus]